MAATTLLASEALTVRDYVCSAGPGDLPFPELHGSHCLSFVRRGSFGYQVRGRRHELVAGAVLVGHVGDEFVCTHEHHAGGDECLSFHFSAELADRLGRGTRAFEAGSAPPLPELMVLGALAQAAAEGRSPLGVDEAALFFAGRYVELSGGCSDRGASPGTRDARRAVEAAHYNAVMEVAADGSGSRVTWTTDLLPHEMAAPIATLQEQGLATMKRTLESARP